MKYPLTILRNIVENTEPARAPQDNVTSLLMRIDAAAARFNEQVKVELEVFPENTTVYDHIHGAACALAMQGDALIKSVVNGEPCGAPVKQTHGNRINAPALVKRIITGEDEPGRAGIRK